MSYRNSIKVTDSRLYSTNTNRPLLPPKESNMKELLDLLKQAQSKTDILILSTPTGSDRNISTDVNIHLLSCIHNIQDNIKIK